MQHHNLDEAISRLPLPVLARRLGWSLDLPDRDGKTFRCFFPERHANGDRNPSCSFYANLTRFKCHGCGAGGRGPDLLEMLLQIPSKEAIHIFVAMAGGTQPSPGQPVVKSKALILPTDLRDGREEDWVAVGKLRHLNPEALALADGMGILKFGTVHGFTCWIVTDESRRSAEARRMDGKPFPPIGSLAVRKAHTLAGSDKSWPVGLCPRHRRPELFRRIALVEGGPDLLAAYHFLIDRDVSDTLPVAMLGRNCKRIHSGALALMKGRDVRAFPHADDDGGGICAVKQWLKQMHRAGALNTDAFNVAGLHCDDGTPAKDLNDCVRLHESKLNILKQLFSHE